MATKRIYSPDTSEPFDVPAAKADRLVLEKGWTRTPWTRVPVEEAAAEPEPVVKPARGRGRKRRATEEAPIEHFHGPAPFVFEEDEEAGPENWRS